MTPEQQAIVKETIPLLEEHGEALTRTFYDILFEKHPALLNIFNSQNMQAGAQQRALATAILAYAKHIENPAALMGAVELIAHKHASYGVAAEHYPVVGAVLLEALQKQFNLPSDHAVIDAWGTAYGILADVFVKREGDLYRDLAAQKGGWSGLRDFKVARISKETDAIKSLYLEPADGGALPQFEPGQYVGVEIRPDHHDYQEIRHYSLCNQPGEPLWHIAVKAENEPKKGLVSNWIHEHIKVGDILKLRAPTGVFTRVKDGRPAVFLGAGIGVTPLLSLLGAHVREHGAQSAQFLNFVRSSKDQAFKELFAHYKTQGLDYSLVVEEGAGDLQGRISQALLSSAIKLKDCHYYLCGPLVFLQTGLAALRAQGVEEQFIHSEFFGPELGLPL